MFRTYSQLFLVLILPLVIVVQGHIRGVTPFHKLKLRPEPIQSRMLSANSLRNVTRIQVPFNPEWKMSPVSKTKTLNCMTINELLILTIDLDIGANHRISWISCSSAFRSYGRWLHPPTPENSSWEIPNAERWWQWCSNGKACPARSCVRILIIGFHISSFKSISGYRNLFLSLCKSFIRNWDT